MSAEFIWRMEDVLELYAEPIKAELYLAWRKGLERATIEQFVAAIRA